MGKVIVIGNEKGGCGKTTIAMHLIISLLKLGFKVGSIDLDIRQQSLSRYIANRGRTLTNDPSLNLVMPEHKCLIKEADYNDNEEEARFLKGVNALNHNDFIVVDTPGSDTPISRIAHRYAEIIITPINISFIDVDLIGQVTSPTLDTIKPGVYSAMLWEQKMKRAANSYNETKWMVVKNRLLTLDAINSRNVEIVLDKLAKRFGFKIVPGFCDRVIFKELFLDGLTLHDAEHSSKIRLSPSVIAAKLELRNFITALEFPEINSKVNAA